MEPSTQRWTAGRKAELVVAILKQEKTPVDACRENDLKQSEVKKWIDQFMDGGTRNLELPRNGRHLIVSDRDGRKVLEWEIQEAGIRRSSRQKRRAR